MLKLAANDRAAIDKRPPIQHQHSRKKLRIYLKSPKLLSKPMQLITILQSAKMAAEAINSRIVSVIGVGDGSPGSNSGRARDRLFKMR